MNELRTCSDSNGIPNNVKVAPLLKDLAVIKDKESNKEDANVMGGVIAFIANNSNYSGVYQGSRASFHKVKEQQNKIKLIILRKNNKKTR